MVFNPQVSIFGTQLINKYPEDKAEIQLIEKKLPEYLYDYSKYSNADFSQAKMVLFNKKQDKFKI
jgi:hypothetical protein